MKVVGGAERPAGASARESRQELRRLAHQLESVFLNQLFQAMRASVPRDPGGASAGGEMFEAMLDQRVAEVATERMHSPLGEALVRQLARRLGDAGQERP